MENGTTGISLAKYQDEKITRIREKFNVVFESECLLSDAALSEHYDLTRDGDLVIILK